MDTSIVGHQWGMTLEGWLGAVALAVAGIALGLILGRLWGGRPPQHD
jgi:hypothetical protein